MLHNKLKTILLPDNLASLDTGMKHLDRRGVFLTRHKMVYSLTRPKKGPSLNN